MLDSHFFRSTAGGKTGAIDGLNLFFGALLGANLGTMQNLGLFDYFEIIVLLAGTVMVIRMLSTSERRVYMLVNVVIYTALVGGVLLLPKFQPKGVAIADLHKVGITLAVWVFFVLVAELAPTKTADADGASD